MQRKIVQATAVKIDNGEAAVVVIALDNKGRLWSTYSLHVPSGEENWNEWASLPEIPDDVEPSSWLPGRSN